MAFRPHRALVALAAAVAILVVPVFAQPHFVGTNKNIHEIQSPAPSLPVLEVPILGGGFATHSTIATDTYQVLPLFGATPMVQMWLSATGNQLHVRATPAGAAPVIIPEVPSGTTLTQTGFQVLSVNRTKTPAQWHIRIQLPINFVGLRDYTIAVTSSLPQPTTPMAGIESLPRNFRLVGQTNYNVAVTVTGNGTVVSGPPGMNCSSGGAGTCNYGFSPGSPGVPPAPPGTFDPTVTVVLGASFGGDVSFAGWGGACAAAASSKQCILKLDGINPVTVSASFKTAPQQPAGGTCPTHVPTLGNMTYADMPECTPSVGATSPALCDANGYFCCEHSNGANSARCGGQDMHEFPADCMQNQNYSLKQPYGCYH